VAIKSISKEIISHKEVKDKIEYEIGILEKLKHISIIQLFETFESKKNVLLVFEICTGGDLLIYVRKRKKLKENLAKIIFIQILEGIHHCHKNQIVHRDIKLDNILLNSNGDIKVIFTSDL